MATATDPALTLAQWFSPGFPIGAFSYSHGLEWLVAQGELRDAQTLAIWIEALLREGTGRNDAVFIVSAYEAQHDKELEIINELCVAYCSGQGRRTETTEQGAAFARTVRQMHDFDLEDFAFPVAVGRASALADLPLDMTVRFYLQAFAANLVSAAVRHVPLGQVEGQQVLFGLAPTVEQIARAALDMSLADLSTTSFAAEIAGMSHETLYSKVFRT